MGFFFYTVVGVTCDVSGEEEGKTAEDEEELQLPGPDGVSPSPGKTGLSNTVDADGLSPGGDADTRGERLVG